MQITVFGATGMVGKQLVKQATWLGYKVIAFGRNAHEIFADATENVTAFKGYLTDLAAISKALQGSTAVCSALGGSLTDTDNTRSIGVKNIVKAMNDTDINNIAIVGGVGILQASEDKMVYETEHFPPQYKAVTEEHLKAYQIVEATNIDYAFFCPGIIIDEGFNEQYTMQANDVYNTIQGVNAGNLADAMLKEVVQHNYKRQRIAIKNR
jgi:uncharacterized protein